MSPTDAGAAATGGVPAAAAPPPSSEHPSLLDYFRQANPNAMDTSVRDILLAEGA